MASNVGQALRAAETVLAAAGIETATLDAELLLRHVLGWDRATLFARDAKPIPPEAEAAFQALTAERARRRPLQHLTGIQAFWRHEFLVTPDVLIPRPETELIVEAALEVLEDVARPIVVDMGTGSGCIALSIAAERPDAALHATDVSEAALGIAQLNAHHLSLGGRVSFHLGDLLGPVASLAGAVDLIACNPPYVAEADLATLSPEVRDHDPRMALVPPGDVLSVYRRLLPAAVATLKPGGWLILEVGQGQADAVCRLAREAGFDVREVKKDLQGIPRTIVCRR